MNRGNNERKKKFPIFKKIEKEKIKSEWKKGIDWRRFLCVFVCLCFDFFKKKKNTWIMAWMNIWKIKIKINKKLE